MILLKITWHDAVSDEVGWKKLEKLKRQQPAVVQSVGFEIKRTKRYLTLAASLVDDECDGDVTIPVGMIIREEILEPVAAKVRR